MNTLLQGNALLALAAAALWGGGDFAGGMGAKHAGGTMGAALRVLLLSHAASFSVLLTVVSGAGFGIYFVALKGAGAAGVFWPMATARMGSLSVCSLMLLGLSFTANGQRHGRLTRRAVAWALGTAMLDTSGNLLFIAATRAGRLDVAAVLSSLYPASTILLAAWRLHERPSARQLAGMAVAAAAVAMISL